MSSTEVTSRARSNMSLVATAWHGRIACCASSPALNARGGLLGYSQLPSSMIALQLPHTPARHE